jgi:hypothetical protein
MNMSEETGKGLPLYVKILAGLLIGGVLGHRRRVGTGGELCRIVEAE